MLFFYDIDETELASVQADGLSKPVSIPSTLSESARTGTSRVLVIDPVQLSLEKETWYGAERLDAEAIPVNAIINVNPYRHPQYIVAGGGFVTRDTKQGKEIILILRKGLWDIPKGKLDEGETIEDCAVREVMEEVGIKDVQRIQPLGFTWHAYEKHDTLYVKRTYWYEMHTSANSFSPQIEERIERVEWVDWDEAKRILGYPTFVMHMEHVENLIFQK